MKHALKLTLIAAALLCGTALHAQKFGVINSQELIISMPEYDSVQTKMQAMQKDYMDILETIEVEMRNKLNDYQKNSATMSNVVRQVKEKEIQDLEAKLQENQQYFYQELQKSQSELMAPVLQKAEEAIKKVGKAQAMLAVFDTSSGSLAYHDESAMTNLLPLVKAELGITK